jgi:hypothetical protein
VTYVWSTGPDEVAMRTVYGKEMPGHCAIYFSPRQATRRLSCLRRATQSELAKPEATVVASALRRSSRTRCNASFASARRCGITPDRKWRASASCHSADDGPILKEHHRGAWDLARRISMRLGHVPVSALESTA